MARVFGWSLCACALVASCGTSALPPLGEALVVVDTDVPVPRLAGRLRIDAYAEDGTWYGSRDLDRARASDWPVSFSVYSPDPNQGRVARLRLRAYPDGKVRDYRGERYAPRPTGGAPGALTPLTPPSSGDAPRLIAGDGTTDITPPLEPEPLVTLDRLIEVKVLPGVRGSVRVVLRGACAGTMADVANGKTCVDAENTLVAVGREALDPSLARPTASVAGTFGAVSSCSGAPRAARTAPDGTPLFDDEVCVAGGAFVFGAPTYRGYGNGDAVPERVAVVDSFRMDRFEVTVGRARQALRDGFVPPEPLLTNDAAIPTAADPNIVSGPAFCTYSHALLGRETYPLNCVRWNEARAFCQFFGGDLPTEVQWEYAAAQSGRDAKTPYPWGGDDTTAPTCDRAVIARDIDFKRFQDCVKLGRGPLPVDSAAHPGGDVTPGLGIVDLSGNVDEWALDNAYSLGANCWMTQPLANPACIDPASSTRSIRGGSWSDWPDETDCGVRTSDPEGGGGAALGFRCVRSAGP